MSYEKKKKRRKKTNRRRQHQQRERKQKHTASPSPSSSSHSSSTATNVKGSKDASWSWGSTSDGVGALLYSSIGAIIGLAGYMYTRFTQPHERPYDEKFRFQYKHEKMYEQFCYMETLCDFDDVEDDATGDIFGVNGIISDIKGGDRNRPTPIRDTFGEIVRSVHLILEFKKAEHLNDVAILQMHQSLIVNQMKTMYKLLIKKPHANSKVFAQNLAAKFEKIQKTIYGVAEAYINAIDIQLDYKYMTDMDTLTPI